MTAPPPTDHDAGQAVVAPPPGNPRFPLVDALRALAALTVLVYHTGEQTNVGVTLTGRLDVGVTLFFLISGFLLYRPFVAHRLLGAPATRLRDYARRRLLRILPAYWLALTVLAIWPGLPGVFSDHWWVYYGLLQTYNAGTVLRGIGPAWTLCVEVSFYAALPLWAALAGRVLRRRSAAHQVRAELAVLGCVVVASLALRWYLVADHPYSPLQNTLPAFADWFAVGMAFAVASVALQARDRQPAAVRIIARAPWLCWLGAAGAWTVSALALGGPHRLVVGDAVALVFTPGESVAIHALFTVVAAGLLAPAILGTNGGGWIRELLSWRVLAWLGLISYGIYLWQAPFINRACSFRGFGTACRMHGPALLHHLPLLTLTIIAAIPTILCAAASYHLVERRILRFKPGAARTS